MNSRIVAGISLPVDLMHRIDEERGDIPRSRYLLRLLEKTYAKEILEQQGQRVRGPVTAQVEG